MRAVSSRGIGLENSFIRFKTGSFGAKAVVTVEVLAYANTEGLIVLAQAKNVSSGAELIWAYGGVNGQRGSRDGDIGTERVPISQYFQFQPVFADDNAFTLGAEGFTLKSGHATICRHNAHGRA